MKVGALQLKYIACKANPDVKSGVYEGGYQLWECTIDLLNFLADEDFTGKVVMDLGCGQGLLGILALLKGAQCVLFQDFNLEVLKELTLPNIDLNIQHDPSLSGRCRFQYGDWSALQTFQLACEYTHIEPIIGIHLLYNPASYGKLSNLLKAKLKAPLGQAILANKLFYFGCGGNLNDFTDHLEE